MRFDASGETMMPMPLLVVDDDADIRESLRDFLEEEGYRVLTAANGREALDMIGSLGETPILLLDLLMPVMSGWEVLDALRTERSTVPVIVLSAAADSSKVLTSGAQRFIPKPLRLDDLLEALLALGGAPNRRASS
jgi:CheY-like chemotaxis protein